MIDTQGSHLTHLRRTQRDIARHPARFKVVACGRRWGKTTLGMVMACRFALAGRRVWWVAPTYKMALHPWRAFKRKFRDLWAQKIESDRHIDLENGGSVTVMSADNPDGLRGVGIHFVVIDEAAFVSDEVWDAAIRPALSDLDGQAMIISTPRGRNWFHRVFQQGQDPLNREWQSWQRPTALNPKIKSGDISEAKSSLPERIFRQEFLAEFLEDGGAVFRDLKKAAVAPLDATYNPMHTYIMGVDFGRYEDFTALVVLDTDTRSVVEVDRFNEVSWSLQRERIAALARKWSVSRIIAEHNSIGDVNIEPLKRQGLPIEPFKTTPVSKPPLIEGLVAALENGELQITPDPVLLGELESFTFRTTRTGHTIYHAPSGRHDDTVIALALAWQVASAAEARIVLGMAAVKFGGLTLDAEWGSLSQPLSHRW